MSDLDIRHGGAISVDTEALRAVGRGTDAVGQTLHEATTSLRRAQALVLAVPGLAQHVDTVAMGTQAERVAGIAALCADTAVGTAVMADVYELVELRARLAAEGIAGGDAGLSAVEIDALEDRLAELEADPRLRDMADQLEAQWEMGRFDGLDDQFDLAGIFGVAGMAPLFSGIALLGAHGGLGTIPAGTVLRGSADSVSVRGVATSTPVGPPTSLAEAFRRFPKTDGAQLTVERYTMPDGSQRFVVYAKGTQSALYGASNPWDMKSNHELYGGERSASYEATLEALRAAGAGPGDAVDIYAHSQAGMIGAHMAMESEFDVRVLVTAGSPVEPTLDDDQLLVQLRHTDDVVSALAGGGSPDGTGSPDSFTAERVGDPARRLKDVALAPHHMEPYLETAEMVDRSGDVRVDALRASWEELADAVEIESIEFRADRTGWDTSE